MGLKTAVTELLGIDYPILCGAMSFITRAEMVAAVANAGGFGILPSAYFETPEALRDEIKKTRSLTDRPFGVNINMFPSVRPIPNNEFIEVIVEEGIKAVETAGHRDPSEYIPRLKAGGVLVIHKAATVRHCLKGQEVGADMVTIVGMENGGATGMEDVSTLVLLPVLTASARVPVIAGGGFADGRGLSAALALGADAVVMGTRFLATRECPVHDNYKQWLVRMTERDTILVMRSLKNTHRALRSQVTEELLAMEAGGASLEAMQRIIGAEATRKTALQGDSNAGPAYAGESVGLIHDIPTIKELINRIVGEAKETLASMSLKLDTP